MQMRDEDRPEKTQRNNSVGLELHLGAFCQQNGECGDRALVWTAQTLSN